MEGHAWAAVLVSFCCYEPGPGRLWWRGTGAACLQVVLADPKDREKDIVAFLAAEHQCGSQEESGQRVAVTALHRVAGERALHRVLPEMYRPLWHQLGEHVSCANHADMDHSILFHMRASFSQVNSRI